MKKQKKEEDEIPKKDDANIVAEEEKPKAENKDTNEESAIMRLLTKMDKRMENIESDIKTIKTKVKINDEKITEIDLKVYKVNKKCAEIEENHTIAINEINSTVENTFKEIKENFKTKAEAESDLESLKDELKVNMCETIKYQIERLLPKQNDAIPVPSQGINDKNKSPQIGEVDGIPVHSQGTDKNNSNEEDDDNPVPSTSQELESKRNPKNSKPKKNKKPEKGEKHKDGLYPNLRFVQDMTELSDDSSEEEEESVSWAAKMTKS